MKKHVPLLFFLLLALQLALPSFRAEAAAATYHISYVEESDGSGICRALADTVTGEIEQGSSFLVEVPDFSGYRFSRMTARGVTTIGESYDAGETGSAPARFMPTSNTREYWVTVYYTPGVVTYTLRYYYFPDPNNFVNIRGISRGTLTAGSEYSFTAPEIDGYTYSDISYFRILPDGSYTRLENVWDSDTLTLTPEAGDGHYEISFNYAEASPDETEPVETEPVETEPLPTETEPVETEPLPTETEPVETEPLPTETEPVETEPLPTETEPLPTETEPVETEPAETLPLPTETSPAESSTAVPTQPVSTEGESRPSGEAPGSSSALLKSILLGAAGVAVAAGSLFAGIRVGKASKKKGKRR